ncbi:MAG: hypothetical protein Q7S40_10315 [Opitutaceae bacterium]|nr:hypothetical protein [Opitutaceae bacterium]
MQLLRLSLLLSIIPSGLFAAAPDSFFGYVYYQSGGTLARTSYQFGVALEADGTFRQLFAAGTRLGSSVSINTGVADGNWTYRRIDNATAEFTLTSSTGGNPLNGKRTLRFTSDGDGLIEPETLPAGITSGAFRIAPAAIRAPLVNCSNRSFVRPGGLAFTGFVIAGDSPRAVVVRAVGPGLAVFGINDGLADPKIVIAADAREVAENDDWNAAGPIQGGQSIERTSAYVGAFPISSPSKDAAIVVQLRPGAYVAEVSSSAFNDAGEVLIEVYMLP